MAVDGLAFTFTNKFPLNLTRGKWPNGFQISIHVPKVYDEF